MKLIRNILVLLIGVSLIACTKNKSVEKPEHLIKQEGMIEILTDLYLTDGLMNVPEVRTLHGQKDTTTNYMEVLEDHGYTKSEFDKNLDYYILAKPKKIQLIYDQVLINLSNMQDIVAQERESTSISTRNLWTGKTSFRMPDDGTTNPIEFSFPTEGLGLYKIRARVNIFEDDQSIDLASSIYFWYDDGSDEGVRQLWDSHIYEKGGRSEVITYEMTLSDSSFTHVKGKLLSYKPQSEHWEMHSSLSGINANYISDTEKISNDQPEK